MRKSLPAQFGFTLVELLVVIVILAILGTIGVSVFSGVQRNARDAKRVEDMNQIGKSLETSKDISTLSVAGGTATYVNNLSIDFPRGIPTDPSGITTTNYCIGTSTSVGAFTADLTTTTWPAVGTPSTYPCPTVGAIVYVKVDSTAFAALTKSWQICARKENTATIYCVRSLQ